MADFSTSGLVNVSWVEALRHPPPGEEDAQRRFRAIEASCNASVVVCAVEKSTPDAVAEAFCTGASLVKTAPAHLGHLIMPHPRLRRLDGGDGEEQLLEIEEDLLDGYKWGLAISCPERTSTGIQWRKDKCVYKMGERIDPKKAYNVDGEENERER